MVKRLYVSLRQSLFNPLKLFLWVSLVAVSYIVALGLRFEFSLDDMESYGRLWTPLLLLLIARTGTAFLFGVFTVPWRYFSLRELSLVVKAVGSSTVLFALAVLFLRVQHYPRSVFVIEALVFLVLLGAILVVLRSRSERERRQELLRGSQGVKRVLLLGAGETGHFFVRTLSSSRGVVFQPVGVLDDNRRLRGTQVHGVPVVGVLSDLETFLKDEEQRVSSVVLAIPSLPKSRVVELKKLCASFAVPLTTLPAAENLAIPADSLESHGVVEAALQRETDIEHEGSIQEQIRGKRLLITGGGGSIGSELVRQVLQFQPARMVVLDSSEFNLFQLQQEIAELVSSGSLPAGVVRCVVGNIRDRARLARIFAEEQPSYVFHAAAYKHVPLMEDNPYEAFVTNILGTRNVIDAAIAASVRRLVLVSTDKAVAPVNIMGASKRVAELLMAEAQHARGETELVTVRFGNVINSAGSVVPLFKQQIMNGGPVTVTHPDVERYFMSIHEAVQLVLLAGVLGTEGEVYVLEMGERLKLIDVARKMIALYATREVEIRFTGLRPGERLTEELIMEGESLVPTPFRKLQRLRSSLGRSVSVRAEIERIEAALSTLDEAQLGVAILKLATSGTLQRSGQSRFAVGT